MAFRRERHPDMNLNEIDFSITYQICQNFDIDRSWEQLAGVIGYSTSNIQTFELETRRHDGSPTKKLLWDWGSRGATVRDLHSKLNLINKTQSMRLLEPIMKIDNKAQKQSLDREDPSSILSNDENLTSSSMPSKGHGKLPIPKKKNPVPPSYNNVDVNFNTSDGKPAKPSEKDKQKLLGLDGVGTSHVRMQECHIDGPASGPGNLGAAASSARSFERVKSVVDEYDTSNTLYMSQLSNPEQEMAKALIAIPHYTYKELSQATDGFSPRYVIGEGKFGKIFKGRVKNTDYAIKKLFQKPNLNLDSNTSLAAELKSLSRYRHENIVSLYAYALDGDEICLVYQYMHNGSLEDCLHKSGGKKVLTWEQRMIILRGAACGLQFLHTVDLKPVIHGNIKSSNILLDKHLEARIGDLAMAQQATGGDVTGKFTHITKKNTGVKDYINMAYLPPEMVRGSGSSLKGDTFAFGVVMFECLTGQEAFDNRREGSAEEKNLNVYIDNYLLGNPKCNKQKIFQDQRLEFDYPEPVFVMMFETAEKCTKGKKRDRPLMVEVYKIAESMECSRTDFDYCNFKGSKVTSGIPKVQDLPLKKQTSSDENTAIGIDNPPSKVNQALSPVDYLPPELLPEPFKLQMEVDKRKEMAKESNYVNVENLHGMQDLFKSDPKKLAEIEKNDAYFEPGSMNKLLEDIPQEKLGNVNKLPEEIPQGKQPCEMKFETISKNACQAELFNAKEEKVDEKCIFENKECHDYVNVPVEINVDKQLLASPVNNATHELLSHFDAELEEIKGKGEVPNGKFMDIFNRYDNAKEEELDDAEFAAQYEGFDVCFTLEKEHSDCSTLIQGESCERTDSFHLSEVRDEDLFESDGDGDTCGATETVNKTFQENVTHSPGSTKELEEKKEKGFFYNGPKDVENPDNWNCLNGFANGQGTANTTDGGVCYFTQIGTKALVENTENRLEHINLGKRDVDENEEAPSLEIDNGNNQSGGSIDMSLQKHRVKEAQYRDVLNDIGAKREGDMMVDNLIARQDQVSPKKDNDIRHMASIGQVVKGPPSVYHGLKVSPVGSRVPSESEYV